MSGINQFVPNYVIKSDYLPTRVIDGNNSQTAELVKLPLRSSDNTKRKKEEEESSHKGQLTLTQIVTHPTRFTKS